MSTKGGSGEQIEKILGIENDKVCHTCPRDAKGRILRNRYKAHRFGRSNAHKCPMGKRCVVDHIIPLSCLDVYKGLGMDVTLEMLDTEENYQMQTTEEAREKDKWEWREGSCIQLWYNKGWTPEAKADLGPKGLGGGAREGAWPATLVRSVLNRFSPKDLWQLYELVRSCISARIANRHIHGTHLRRIKRPHRDIVSINFHFQSGNAELMRLAM